ncbi:DUF7002 family protein [Reyranella sp.]|uniref:DUF7002 family protein n=1 Tax=Reyranella sp. TaxID=1929291 RepID=UPI003BA97D21
MAVKVEDLISKYPRLWHMAEFGSWPAIEARGLRSTRALLDDYDIHGTRRKQLLSERRPACVMLEKKGLPTAVLRDQIPMTDKKLENCLQGGLTPSDWYELLNSHSFFWLSRNRIWTLLQARAYRDLRQTVLTVDTESLVLAYQKNIWLSPINSGATLFSPQPRGPATFQKIEDFPFEQRRKTRSLHANVVELLVQHSVPDIRDYVLAVHTVKGDEILEEIWRSPRATAADHP